MKSCLSLLAALLVAALLAGAGYKAYQKSTSPEGQSGHVLTAASGDASLTLTNGTSYVLTVTMKQGPSLARFQLAPGKTETRSFPPGNYNVEGSLSDPQTDPFSSQWSFEHAGNYSFTFTRDAQAKAGGALLLGAAQASGNSQASPTNRRPSNLIPPKRP
ncbi:MAG: hypothetical protein ACRD23_21060 [Terriglobales bacterium]